MDKRTETAMDNMKADYAERDRLRAINAELLAALKNTRQYVETAHRAMKLTDKLMARAVKDELDRIDAAITRAEAGK